MAITRSVTPERAQSRRARGRRLPREGCSRTGVCSEHCRQEHMVGKGAIAKTMQTGWRENRLTTPMLLHGTGDHIKVISSTFGMVSKISL